MLNRIHCAIKRKPRLVASATVTFSPSSIAANGGAQTVTVTIIAPASAARLHRESSRSRTLTPFALGFLFLFGAASLRRRGRMLRGLLCVLVLTGAGAAAGTLSGCGANNGYFAQAPQSYTVTLTATAGSVQHTSTITLNVQ